MADIIISKIIKNVNVPQAVAGFLKEHPMPQIDNSENPGTSIDKYTMKQWFKKVIFDYADREIKEGLDKLRKEDAEKYTSVFE